MWNFPHLEAEVEVAREDGVLCRPEEELAAPPLGHCPDGPEVVRQLKNDTSEMKINPWDDFSKNPARER